MTAPTLGRSRLFTTLVLMGAALAGGVIACGGSDDSSSTGTATSASAADDAGADADAAPAPPPSEPEQGWPTTK